MSPLKAHQLVAQLARDLAAAGHFIGPLHDLANQNRLTKREIQRTRAKLAQLTAEGIAPEGSVEAFDLAAADIENLYAASKARLRREIAADGEQAVGAELEQRGLMGGVVLDAFMDACREAERRSARLAPPPAPMVSSAVLVRTPRRRESGSRRLRTAAGSDDDDGLADRIRRCPRCGAAARPRPGALTWTCDHCLHAAWEALVAHELRRVLDEADRIARGAA